MFSLQGSQLLVNQQSGPAPSFSLDYLNTVVAPALLTDGNGNHFLVALTNHVSEIQKGSTTDNNIATAQHTPEVHTLLHTLNVCNKVFVAFKLKRGR